MITVEEFCYFADKALDEMVEIVGELGDDRANARPDLPDANSPYVILNHCLGVMSYWAGEIVAGRDVQRDRAAEFTASGPVAELLARTERARAQLHEDAATVQPGRPPRRLPKRGSTPPPMEPTQGAMLLHVYEELAEHLGQLQLTRDILRAG